MWTFDKAAAAFPLALAFALNGGSALASTEGGGVDDAGRPTEIEEIVVWGRVLDDGSENPSPTSVLVPDDLVSINVATAEDVVKYEPSIVIRRRFIGDSNGTMGMRGSNMFQTSRSMVFADGVPLHYLLQSRWNGAPRWTMVSASEIARVDILYGPFSAEYSGNSMGGVIEMETAIPQQRELHIDSSFFSQQFDAYGFDDSVTGYKTFVSYGDKAGPLSYYLSYNRLDNESQPQTFYYGSGTASAALVPVTGAIRGADELGTRRLFFGDTGIIDTTTNNYKLKLGYEFGDWSALLNMAYEDRGSRGESPNTYLRGAAGSGVWSGNVIQDGQAFSLPASRLSVSDLNRQSLSTGLRIRGRIGDSVELELNLNRFSVLEDQTNASAANPRDPVYTPAGQVTDYDDTGWTAAEAKLYFDYLGVDGLNLVAGARYETFQLNLGVFDSEDWAAGSKDGYVALSGGETEIAAVYAQLHYDINAQWDVSLGGRFESWKSSNGYYDDDDPATPAFDLQSTPRRSQDEISPKFTLGYRQAGAWTLRYSAAKAYRFPIVEELFSQFEAYNAVSVANPHLAPENGMHQNLLIERTVSGGYLRLNVYAERIRDVIEAQSTTLDGGTSLRTFIPIDAVRTWGAEFIANVQGLLLDNLDLRFNLAYTDSTIEKNDADPSIEGKTYPRMPKWRGNLLATYYLTNRWDVGGSVQYASDSYGRTDNADRQDNVYGAQDGYTRIGLKSTYRMTNGVSLGVGIDNLSNEIAYVAHPWPGRSYYVNVAYSR